MTVRIFDADKKPVAAEIQRTDRVDVNQLFEEATRIRERQVLF